MPSPVRRSGSGLLQIPRPGLLPSPYYAGLGPLGPSRVVLSTRQSSLSLRPAAALLLASSPGSHPTPENLLPRSSGDLRGRDSHPPVDWPFTGHDTIRTFLQFLTASRFGWQRGTPRFATTATGNQARFCTVGPRRHSKV